MKRSRMMIAAVFGVGVLVLGVSPEQAEGQCYYYGVPTVPYYAYAVPPGYVYSAPPMVYAPPVVQRTYVAPVYVPRHYYYGPVYYRRPRGFGFGFSFHGHGHHHHHHH